MSAREMEETVADLPTPPPEPPPSTSTALMLPGTVGENKEGEDGPEMPLLFSTRRPRNASAGASSGLKSVAKGVGMGVVGLVAAPVIGAKENGVKGFVGGLAAGLVGAVALPVAGAVVGAVQLGRGLYNTPEALAERAKGKVWDEDTRSWVVFDLNEEAREMLAITEEEWCKQHGVKLAGDKDGPSGRSGQVKETELYDILGVESDASSSAIRKAYFKMAKELHPDKNMDDPNAHAKFQAVGEAYQVLSSDELRAKYDASGKAALETSSLVDPTHFFAMLFGSEPFEYLIGELKLATIFANGGEMDEAYMNYHQKRREVTCALTLKGLLQQFCFGDEAEFEAEMHTHAKVLVEAPVGDALIWTCGYIYEHKGMQALGGFDAIGSNVQQTMHTAASQMRVAGAAIKTYRAFRKDVANEKDKDKKKDDKASGEGGEASPPSPAPPPDFGGDAAGGGGGGQGSSSAVDLMGKRVRIEGLQGRADLNGSLGVAGSFDASAGRYAVALDHDGECVKVKPANLVQLADEVGGGADGGGGPGGGASGARGQPSAAGAGEASEGGALGPSENTMYLMLESMWRVSLLDIESTLRHACNKVLSDKSTDKNGRRNRARGLVVMGRVFQSYGSPDALKTVDFAKHVESVGQKVAEEMQAEQQRKADAGE